MNPQAGIVLATMFGLWLVYYVPHRLRMRQDLSQARTEDRFSADLRVVRAAQTQTKPGHIGVSAGELLAKPRAVLPAVTEVRRVSEISQAAVRTARQTAAERSARVAMLARRAAARRRRAVLTTAVTLLAVGMWVGVKVASWHFAVAIVPTLAVAGLILAGHQANKAARSADAAWEARRHTPIVPTTRVVATMLEVSPNAAGVAADERAVGRSAHPNEQLTEWISERPVAESVTTSGEGIPTIVPTSKTPADKRPTVWVPKPVPAPAYTLKAPAPRRSIEPLGFGPDGRLLAVGIAADDGAGVASAPVAADICVGASGSSGEKASSAGQEAEVVTTGSMDLNEILARRRASGM